jgi:hypothetical protein
MKKPPETHPDGGTPPEKPLRPFRKKMRAGASPV